MNVGRDMEHYGAHRSRCQATRNFVCIVVTVSAVWFISTSWRRNWVFEPYRSISTEA